MKTKILSGSTLAAAAVALALSGVAVTPAAASHHHRCTMEKGKCGGKTKCMTKGGHCIHHMKSHCSAKHHCRAKHSCKK
jgi:uncharacterized membrane protein